MTPPKHVRHPGPISPLRLESHLGAATTLTLTLEPGLSLNEAIARPLRQAGLTAAAVTLTKTRFHPFRYVIPAHAHDDSHAAYYSDTFAPPHQIELEFATLTFGSRADGPFLHCHALWRNQAGGLDGGHILPLDAILAAPAQAEAFGTDQVEMRADYDPETNFHLFRPIPLAAPAPGSDCLVARIRPNQDLVDGIEALCRRHALTHARIHSGIGSTSGMTFDDGRIIHERPTELLTLDGHIEPDAAGHVRAHLRLAVIDVHGAIHQGRPARGQNPVLICFELFFQALNRH